MSIYFSSSTFQYASLTNFDQLSIRSFVGRVQRVPRRLDRLLAQPHPGLLRRAVGLALVARQAASTQLSHRDSPPWARGTTWSIVSSSLPGWRPQYWQV